MTVENLWYNNKKYKGINREKMGPKHNYEYDLNSIEKANVDLIKELEK